ncbi:hypothetical protein F2P81_011129 [Scophthalmus maximus]|uniref:Uncharacterized protein n=1 Tax=Scophthalmus maximus TaxID=52904 RepID=A0A6A4SR02_SCOMX|nr:hypothetical protein F2P81_011129 [Scophthalmus maximus]
MEEGGAGWLVGRSDAGCALELSGAERSPAEEERTGGKLGGQSRSALTEQTGGRVHEQKRGIKKAAAEEEAEEEEARGADCSDRTDPSSSRQPPLTRSPPAATMRAECALVLTAALLLDAFWGSNGERASSSSSSSAPCRPGFSQSFYSVLVSRDVLLQGRDILKGIQSGSICSNHFICDSMRLRRATKRRVPDRAQGISSASALSLQAQTLRAGDTSYELDPRVTHGFGTSRDVVFVNEIAPPPTRGS